MNGIVAIENIQKQIYTIRGLQVMLDEDIAELYGVETKRLNEQVRRNIERFPEEFMFKLNETDMEILKSQFVASNNGALRSQFATLKSGRGQHRKYLPYVFTEQGVAMLSAVLRSETAVKVSIQIINAFIAMRRFIANNGQLFHRMDVLENKQVQTDQKIDMILNAIESKEVQPKQGIFYDGQVFDAYKFLSDILRTAKQSIVIIDNYIDDSVLVHLTKLNKTVKVTILTKTISKQLNLDVKKYNNQYPPIDIIEFKNSHDRFLIIDDNTVYHFGASLKDLGKKWFAFSKFDKEVFDILSRVKKAKQAVSQL